MNVNSILELIKFVHDIKDICGDDLITIELRLPHPFTLEDLMISVKFTKGEEKCTVAIMINSFVLEDNFGLPYPANIVGRFLKKLKEAKESTELNPDM